MGRVCVSLYVLDRSEGFNLACSGLQVPSRWGHPFGSSLCTFVCARSERRF